MKCKYVGKNLNSSFICTITNAACRFSIPDEKDCIEIKGGVLNDNNMRLVETK